MSNYIIVQHILAPLKYLILIPYYFMSLHICPDNTNPHWARVVGYGPFSLYIIHKEGLCPSSDIKGLMMMTNALEIKAVLSLKCII
jgi:hypothetical protein